MGQFAITRKVTQTRWRAAEFNDVEWVLLKEKNGDVQRYECYWADPNQIILVRTLDDGKHRLEYLAPTEEERIVGIEKYSDDDDDDE